MGKLLAHTDHVALWCESFYHFFFKFYVDPHMQGLFNSIAYGFNSSVRRTLQEKLDL